jgi:hypothetical protein
MENSNKWLKLKKLKDKYTKLTFFFFRRDRMIELVYILVGISQTAPAELVGKFQMTCMT